MKRSTMDVLVVDGDATTRERVSRALQVGSERPVRIWEADNSAAALDLCQAQQPALIVLGARLPDTQAATLLPVLAHRREPVPIPVVSLVDPAITGGDVAAADGAWQTIATPDVTPQRMGRFVRSAGEQARLQQEVQEWAEARVAAEAARLRELAGTLIVAGQQERRRIGRRLHDEVQQILYGIQTNAYIARKHAAPAVREKVEVIEAMVEEAIETLRALTAELGPPAVKTDWLSDILLWLATHMADQYGLDVELAIEGEGRVADEGLRELLFQTTRGLLANVSQHAAVGRARLEMAETAGQLCIRVQDEGKGFDVDAVMAAGDSAGSAGLRGMRARLQLFGGDMQVVSEPGVGTQVTLTLPLT